ncbi:MAG TPA: hypothetical protein VGO58_20330 [Chitinophagaceae bacterium]|jgi:hypothetical protein|nr:hypothetical protein [Chitinophagaceae bacterium]
MRKLFLLLSLAFSTITIAQKNPCNPTGIPYASLPGDTTLLLPQGTYVTFNRCEFFDLRDCLEFDELYDQASVVSRGFTTQDNNGNILLTCGMFRIRLKPGCSEKECFEVPVKIRMPYQPNLGGSISDTCGKCPPRTIRLFTSNGGNWSDTSKLDSRIIEVDGKKYFGFMATCANKAYNCDCAKKGKTKVRFKSRGDLKIDELFIRAACPVSILKFYQPTNSSRRRIVVKLPCLRQDQLFVRVVGTDASGQVIKLLRHC